MGSGDPGHTAECGYCRVHLLRLQAFLEYIFIEPLNFVSAHGPRRSRRMPRRLKLALVPGLTDVHVSVSKVSSSLYSYSQRSCWRQRRGSRREAAHRKDTRQDRWLYFLPSRHQALLQCGFKCLASRAEEGKVPGTAGARNDRLRVKGTVAESTTVGLATTHEQVRPGMRRCQL